jgi:hypothetical protein
MNYQEHSLKKSRHPVSWQGIVIPSPEVCKRISINSAWLLRVELTIGSDKYYDFNFALYTVVYTKCCKREDLHDPLWGFQVGGGGTTRSFGYEGISPHHYDPHPTTQLPPESGLPPAPGIISRTTARHRARTGD